MSDRATSIDIVNIVVCYNNVLEIKKYINELNSLDDSSRMMLVVVGNDNSSEKDFLNEINDSKAVVKYLKSPGNIGYMKGFFYGYQQLLDVKPKWYIMSNTDILYPQKNFISLLLEKDYDNVCCIGPDIYVPETGAHQNPMAINKISRFQLKKLCLLFNNQLLGSFYIFLSTLKKKIKHFSKDEVSKKIYLAHGSYMVFSPDFLKTMNEVVFEPLLYGEELYVAELARKTQKSIFYDADLKIIHNEHSVTGKVKMERKVRLMAASFSWLYKKFFCP